MPIQRLVSTLVIFLLCIAPLCAQDEKPAPPPSEAPAPSPQTTSDPEIPLDHLELLLIPLSKDELLVEAEGWRDLVQAKVQEITNEEIATREKNEEIAEASAEPAISEAVEDKKREEKAKVIDRLTTLREQKAALLERFSAVLNEYEAKGGDPADFRKYATAVSGIQVEVTDVSATWAAVTGWITSKEGGLKWALLALRFVGIMFAFWILSGILGKAMRKATSMHAEMSDLLKRFLNNIVRRAVLLVGLLVALSTMGVNIGALLALIGGSAFIVGFALQDTLGNFAAGLMLLVYRPFDVGDAVEVAGVNGKVDKVSLVSTTIRTFDNKIVLVPNKQVWGQVITNATASAERRVDMVFGIGYDDDTEKAREILERIVANHELVLKDPEPVIQLNELADSSVNFVCRPWTNTDNYWTVFWDVTKQVKAEFDANNISIPYPQQDVHIHQTSA